MLRDGGNSLRQDLQLPVCPNLQLVQPHRACRAFLSQSVLVVFLSAQIPPQLFYGFVQPVQFVRERHPHEARSLRSCFMGSCNLSNSFVNVIRTKPSLSSHSCSIWLFRRVSSDDTLS